MFLIDELHKAMNNIVTIEDKPVVENTLTDIQQMKHFALEAEMNRNYDLAAFYYQEVYKMNTQLKYTKYYLGLKLKSVN